MMTIINNYLIAHTRREEMAMFNPPHPGRQIRTALDACNMNIKKGAEHLGVNRVTLSRVINGQAGISSEMAIRLGKAFNRDAEVWVRMQATYDLAQAMQYADEIEVGELKVA